MGIRRTNNKLLPLGPLLCNRRKPEPQRKQVALLGRRHSVAAGNEDHGCVTVTMAAALAHGYCA